MTANHSHSPLQCGQFRVGSVSQPCIKGRKPEYLEKNNPKHVVTMSTQNRMDSANSYFSLLYFFFFTTPKKSKPPKHSVYIIIIKLGDIIRYKIKRPISAGLGSHTVFATLNRINNMQNICMDRPLLKCFKYHSEGATRF